ncbi:uncharacterized protein PHALS_01606 [Plasmopara halstedii]|uniref:Uncharacterized protein n=1 Tax=Plasmopara halstedii TaxID=4781 RepID=A0A0P1AXC7_PLAHL|nr:uncharacterized protein PHALS_01606 [Plasmopara halstedii]CEG45300.1 hypothetical protein PHALS_01606 [Plasmopara halstedii]|eukprot:XP_024581669.1 hypothetical protein PHALS_01606 [Plasmopara halstedii]
MSNGNEVVRFGDVIKLRTKSAFVESTSESSLGFLELLNKAQTQLLVVSPVKDEVQDRFVEAEFIISPVKGDKKQANGTPLTFETPFVLHTSDGKNDSTYSLNNKVAGQRDGISLQVSATKGEMYIQVEKEGCTNSMDLLYGTDGLSLRVVDSNRVRKSLNHLLTHTLRPKSDMIGGMVTCGTKGSALTFSFQRSVDADGQVKTETIKYIKNPQSRRTSIDALGPTKVDELGRADRIDSSEFSDVDAMSRSSSLAGISSNPASPRSSSMTSALATPVNAAAVAERLPVVKDVDDPKTESSHSTTSAPPAVNEVLSSVPEDSTTEGSLQLSPPASPSEPVSIPDSPPKPISNEENAKTSPVSSPLKSVASASPPKVEIVEIGSIETESVSDSSLTTKQDETISEVKILTPSDPVTSEIETTQDTASATPVEPRTVIADASTFPPIPAINGPAPALIVPSPKSLTSQKTTPKAATTPINVPLVPKIFKAGEVSNLEAEADVEILDPACGAKCSIM